MSEERSGGKDRDHQHWDDDLAAYSLDALSDAEASSVEAHLRECERCREKLRRLEAAVETLPASVPQLAPPAGLRERILDEARRDVPATAQRPRFRPTGLRVRIAALLAVGAAAAGGITGYLLAVETDAEPETIRVQPVAPGIDAEITLIRTNGRGILSVRGLPQLAEGEVYQLWLRRGEDLQPSTVFVLGRDATAVAAIPAGLGAADELLVTREPRGGSRQPTSDPLLRAELG